MKQALIIDGSTGMEKATAALLLEKGIEVAIVARDAFFLKSPTEIFWLDGSCSYFNVIMQII